MKKIIDQLLEGKFEYSRGFLDFSYQKLEIVMEKDGVYEGSFAIYGSSHRLTEGYVYVSDIHMQCLTPRFIGNGEVIMYRFDAKGLEEGDVLTGQFYVVSNQGEYSLPYVVTIAHTVLDSSLGQIKNLFHFANLAKTNWWEAVRLFYSPNFKKIFTGNDKQYLNVYEGLSKYNGNEQNMEEFLLEINKKQKIEYIIEERELILENLEGIVEYDISIIRNGWGYTCLFVETEGEFLYTRKEQLTEDDFLGNTCRLSVQVDSMNLHGGNNYGALKIYNSYTSFTIPVTVKCMEEKGDRERAYREKKRIIIRIMEFYQAFRVKKINMVTWLKETGKQVDKLLELNERDITARLFQAQLLITQEHFHEARWILDHVEELLRKPEADNCVYQAYYLYLTTLLRREEDYIDEIADQVEEMFRYNPNEWRIAWLLLYLKPEYSYSAAKKWMFLEEQFQRGCRSPIIYIEAFQLIAVNATLLMKLGAFEIQLLHYIVKKGLLTRQIIDQIHCLVPKMKTYSDLYYHMLKACYQIRPDNETLTAICTLLIKGNKIGREYFKWYRRGVTQEIRLTRLYEYYMMSMDTESGEMPPKMVLMYFSYHSELDYEKNAYLYYYIHKNREEYQELYLTYQQQIERFVVEQIQRKHINRNLAYLYQNIITPQMLNEETAEAMSSLLFTNIIRTEQKDMKRVVVYQPKTAYEHTYPMSDGVALIPLYGNDYTILFEDGNYNRFSTSISYTIEKLMLPGKLVKMIAPFVHNQVGFDIYISEESRDAVGISEENEERFQYLLENPAISQEYKREISLKLIRYYDAYDKVEKLDAYLQMLRPEQMVSHERKEVLYFLILRRLYGQAYEWIHAYGMQGMDSKSLVRLSSRLIEQTDFREDPVITAMAIQAFRQGKYDENVLGYLVKYYNGMTKEMRNIWVAAMDFHIDTYELSERMLIQMMFTGAYVGERMEVFRTYMAGGAKAEVEEVFLTRCAYDYFVGDKIIDAIVFKGLLRLAESGRELQQVCKLACLKFYAENKAELEEEGEEILHTFLRETLSDGVRFSYYKELQERMPEAGQVMDKTIVEYRGKPDSKAIMHYVIRQEEEEDSKYITEEMNEVFGGVCFKEFVLFFGETLQYYIMEKGAEAEQLTESATIQKSDRSTMMPESKYNLVNDIVMSKALQDFTTVDEMLKEYKQKEYITEKLFPLQ